MSKSKKILIWFERDLLRSKAFASLKTANAHIILAEFYCRRQVEKAGHKWNIKNNGEIEFTYEDAHKRYGIADGTFRRAIDELRDKGFIDIAKSGQGVHKVTNLYSIVDRWRLYGTPEYVKPKPRKKGPVNRGFQKGNQYGKNCKKKSPTVTDEHSSTVTDEHSKAKRG